MTDNDFISAFLFDGSPVHKTGNTVRTEMNMDLRTEGWVGLPHGGIGMASVIELGSYLNRKPGEFSYPFCADYRMGGSRVQIGDDVSLELSRSGSEITGRITPKSAAAPYLTVVLSSTAGYPEMENGGSYLPARFSFFENKLLALPYYKNCFVCGVERRHPGLKRRFQLVDGLPEKPVLAVAGFYREDRESFYMFRRQGFLHPLPLLALLDETIGWAGFMMSESGGVTTRISYTFFRPVRENEKVMVIARGDRLKKTATRVMFWASGVAAVVAADGSFEVVASASGQYLGLPELTAQMRTELIPQELTMRAFDLAGNSSLK